MDPTIDGTLFKLFSSCDLPTQYGTLQFCVFKHRSLPLEAVACISPLTFYDGRRTIFQCVCMMHVLPVKHLQVSKCDCRLQLDKALQYISEFGGIVIYLKQEGRGIGLGNKIAAYNLQETLALDTVEANRKLGLPDDMREYVAVKDILAYLDVESIMLMTNNKKKSRMPQRAGHCGCRHYSLHY